MDFFTVSRFYSLKEESINRQRQELLLENECYTAVAFVVGMEAVVIRILEELGILVHQRIKAAECSQVNHRHCPDVAGFLHGLDVGIIALSFFSLPQRNR